MKKILIVLIFSFSFICSIFQSVKAQSYKVNEIVENEFEMSKKFSINLPEGKWVIAEKSTMYFHGIRAKTYILLRLENNKAVEGIEIGEWHTAGIYENIVNQAIYEILFKNKFDGCYERPEYSIVRFFRKGNSHDCFWAGHIDVYKELFNPEDPELKTANAQLRRYIKQKKIELKEIKLRPVTEVHDYTFKIKNAQKFLSKGDKVKFTIRFKGREMQHTKLGNDLMEKIKIDMETIGKVELQPKFDGKQMIMVIQPL